MQYCTIGLRPAPDHTTEELLSYTARSQNTVTIELMYTRSRGMAVFDKRHVHAQHSLRPASFVFVLCKQSDNTPNKSVKTAELQLLFNSLFFLQVFALFDGHGENCKNYKRHVGTGQVLTQT